MKISAIYIITCLVNNKVYVGKDINFPERLREHKYDLKKNTHHNNHLQNAYNKYGIENFTFEILEEHPKEFLNSMEHYWCNMLQAHNRDYGYNIAPTNPYGKSSASEETKKKMSMVKMGKKHTQSSKDKISKSNFGKKSPHTSFYNKLYKSKKVINNTTGEIYTSIKETAKMLKMDYSYISKMLLNKTKNTKNISYY